MSSTGNERLRRHRGPFVDPSAYDAYRRLMGDTLSIEVEDHRPPSSPWTSFALFEPGGRCVGNVDAAVLPLVLDGKEVEAAGIRSVAVDPDWRGRGLFRDLMKEGLAWCAARPTLLYTEDPPLYHRFGFRSLAQHAFVGLAPAPSSIPVARRLDLRHVPDRNCIGDMVARRAPLSSHCALGVDAALVLTNLAKDEGLTVVHSAEADALIVYDGEDEDLIIADIIAPSIPELTAVLGMLGRRPTRVKILFPPDKLGWRGKAVAEDTGLMIRGTPPDAMTRPFMFPPTAEF